MEQVLGLVANLGFPLLLLLLLFLLCEPVRDDWELGFVLFA
jgi:hypothetical protein